MTEYKPFLQRELDKVLASLGIPFGKPKTYFDLVSNKLGHSETTDALESLVRDSPQDDEVTQMIQTLIGCGVVLAENAPLFRYASGKIKGIYIEYDIMMSEHFRETLEFNDLTGRSRDVKLIDRMKKRYAEEVVSVFGPDQDSLSEEHIVLYIPRMGAIKVLNSDGDISDCSDCVRHFYDLIGIPANNPNKRMLASTVKSFFDKIKAGNAHAAR